MKFIALDVYLALGRLDERQLISSGPRNYVGRSGKRLTTSITLRNSGRSTNKRKASNTNNEVVTKYFTKIIEKFKDIPYLGYRKRWVKNDLTEAYFFLAKQIYQLLKNNRNIISHEKRLNMAVSTKNTSMKQLSMELHQ